MGNAGGQATPWADPISYPEHKAALRAARAKLKMAKESKPIIKKLQTWEVQKETGAVRNKNEFKLQVLPRGDATAISLFRSLPHPPYLNETSIAFNIQGSTKTFRGLTPLATYLPLQTLLLNLTT
jgi:hypothetical protein